jgi:hypothetical protein
MKLAALLIPLVLVGCSTTHRMPTQDLRYFKPDCSRKDEQLRWLKAQMPSRGEAQLSSLMVTSVYGTVANLANGTYDEHRAVHDRRTQAMVRSYIKELETWCPAPKPKPQSCTHVREDFDVGSSQGVVCYTKGQTKPVVNKWEALVDQ